MHIQRLLTAAAAAALLGGPLAAHAAAQADAPQAPAAPSAGGSLIAKGDLAATLKASGDFTILTKALDATNLTPVLKSQPNLTVLAPTDAAFKALPPGELDKLMLPENAPRLQKLLTYHVINARVDAAKIKGAKGPMKTVAGVDVQIDGSADPIKINDASVTQVDVKASNGEIYVIDKVLIPAGALAEARAGALAATAQGVDVSATAPDQAGPVNPPAAGGDAAPPPMPPPGPAEKVPPSVMATPAAQSSTDASAVAPAAAPMSSQGDEARWKYGDPGVVSNAPIPDTRENRARYGQPMSSAGKHSRLEAPGEAAAPQPQ